MTDVSVIVVNHRSADLTLRALEAARAAARDLLLEEIVVDNGSGHDEVARLRAARPGTAIVEAQNCGFAAGNNAGIARASGRYLLLLNPDAFPRGEAVAALADHLDAHPDVGVAAPRLVFGDGARQDSAYRRFPNHVTLLVDYLAPLGHLLVRTPWDPHRVNHRRIGEEPLQIAHATGAALLVRRESAQAAGPLDEGYFMYYEETEWQRRIARAGWRVALVPSAVVVHLGGGSSAGFPLASPHYLASVRRYFGGSRRSRWIVRWGSVVSASSLGILGRMLRHDVLRAQAAGYRRVPGRLGRGSAERVGGVGRRRAWVRRRS